MKSSLPAMTDKQVRRVDRIKREIGCIACWKDSGVLETPADAHHIISPKTGNRMGHDFTIPLCPERHHKHGDNSIHLGKKRFIAIYGTEMDLLETTNFMLGLLENDTVNRRYRADIT